MKLGNLLIGALIGAVGYHLILKSRQKAANKPMSLEEKVKLTSDVVVDESNKYSDVLKKQYDIVMPSDQISKKVEQKANRLRMRRKEIDLNKIKEPVSI